MQDSFEKIKEIEEMADYIRNLNERYNGNEIMLSHYTSISTALNILNGGELWLGDYRKMNDSFENELLNRNHYARNFYFSCFSKADESLAMYNMYSGGNPDSTVILQFSLDTFLYIISHSCDGELIDGVNADGKYPQYTQKLEIIRNGTNTEQKIEATVFGVEVAYYDPKAYELFCNNERNSFVVSPFASKDLVGTVKYKCWEYEQEIRLCAYTMDSLEENDALAIKLPKDIVKNINIILGPSFDMKKHNDELMELRVIGANYSNSIYHGYYGDLTKGYAFRGLSENKIFLEDYINKVFCGEDPWNDKLSIEIIKCNDNKLIWKWINELDYDGKKHRVEILLSSYIDNNLFFEFNFSERLNIFEDNNEFLEYYYKGIVVLSNRVAFVSFNGGGCCAYVFGGGGTNYYSYAGGFRHGMNLYTLLEEKDD